MAYSQEIWDKAKFLFEIGKSLQEISIECNIKDRTSISRKAKNEDWIKNKNQHIKADIIDIEEQNTTLEVKKTTALEKLTTLNDYEITILDKVIEDETGNKSLLFSTANLSLIRKNQMLTKNTKQVIDYETIYDHNGKPISKKPITVDIELSPTDLKALDEGIDKNAVTLEVAPRHANSQVNISNTNASQTNLELNKDIVLQTLKSFDDEY